MSVAAIFKMVITVAMLIIHNGPISNIFQTAFGLNCAKFHAFITKYTIFQLSRHTNIYESGFSSSEKATEQQQPSTRKQLPIPPLQTTAYMSKKQKPEEKEEQKNELDRARHKSRENISVAIQSWRKLRDLEGFKTALFCSKGNHPCLIYTMFDLIFMDPWR